MVEVKNNLGEIYEDLGKEALDYYDSMQSFEQVSAKEESLNDLDPNAQVIDIGYTPREYQQEIHQNLSRFNVLVCHRRFGKTILGIMELVDRAVHNDKWNPQYAYIAPTYAQAKRVAWEYVLFFTANIPGAKANKAELSVTIPRPDGNGGGDRIKIMLLGADNPDSLRGIYLDGCVLDEYAQCHPMLWGEIIRPALSDRKGWAIFIGTPKGENHFHKMYRDAKRLMDEGRNWYAAVYKATDTGVLDDEELDDARATMTDEEFEQEYLCSFTASLIGSYYGKYIKALYDKNHIIDFDYEPSCPVRTYWDLGINDSTAIWFVQTVGNEIRVIDYLENSGVGVEWYIKEIQNKPYIYEYAGHGIPHDGAAREIGTGKSRQETMRDLGLLTHVVPRQSIADGIHATRMLLQRNVYFHKTNCERGLEALKNYQRKWDGKNYVYMDKPLHNWASHGSDAFRMLALDLDAPGDRIPDRELKKYRKPHGDYNELEY